jgi:hypothetical protein
VILATGVKPNATGVILKRTGRRVNSTVLLIGAFGGSTRDPDAQFAAFRTGELRRLRLRA